MLFRLIYDPLLAQASYLIGCQKTGEAIVVDPSRDFARYLQIAAQEKLKITGATETHIHADFLSGCRQFAEMGTKVYLSDQGGPDWNYRWLDKKSGGGRYDVQLVKHNDIIKVGNIELKVIHTPGHTPEHICFEVTDKGGGATDPMGILTGDFIFVGDLGRPDLLETAAGVSGAADASAKLLLESARRFKSTPEHLQVWPGHGAGSACGKALGAVPQSTVGYELRHNTALRAAEDSRRFMEEMLSGQPEPPLYFARMKQQNRDGVPLIPQNLAVRPLGVEDLKTLFRSAEVPPGGPVVIDTRTWAQFKEGHLPGSLYAPANTNLSAVAGSYVKPEDRIILLADPARAPGPQDLWLCLLRIGLDRCDAIITPETLAAYAAAGGQLARTVEISVSELDSRMKSGGVNVLDVRRADEWREGHIKNVKNIVHTRLAARLAEVPKDKPVALHCQGGSRSAYAAAFLERNGFQVANVAGGFGAWESAGLDVVRE